MFDGRVDDEPSSLEGPARAPARRSAAAPTVARGGPREIELPSDVRTELTEAVGQQRGAKLAERMSAAVRAYERDRYQDAARITRTLAEQVPESAAVRELHGLVCYRLGRWREAVKHLEAARSSSGGDVSQLPVLMDCHRAMGHHRRVADLWEELRAASPDADLVAEGRMVVASDLAERGELAAALELLTTAGAGRKLRHPAERHVRQWYVLADLLERAGDLPRARDLFARVVEADPELADAGVRLAALGRRQHAPRRKAPQGPRAGTTTKGHRPRSGSRNDPRPQ